MNKNIKNDRILTIVITLLALSGVIYFGLSVVRDDNKKEQHNPFEYNIDHFKQSGKDQVAYREAAPVAVPLLRLYALAVNRRDRIYVTGDRSLLIFSPDGALVTTTPTDRPISSLAVDADGDIFVAAGEYIEVLDSTGAKKAQWQDLGVDAILTSVALGKKDVYLADAGHLIVWHFNKSGELLGRIGAKDEAKGIPGFVVPSPYFDVAVDSDDYLWAANPGLHQLENYTSDGRLRSFWNRSSMEIEGFSGCCNPTHIAVLEDGSFVTSEKGIPRVKIVNAVGEVTAVVAGPDQFDEGAVGLDLAVDSNQRILVLDPKRKQVRIFVRKES
jgi:hypothetical protein